MKVASDGTSTAYPNASWNDWEIGKPIDDSVFVAVQSVVAHENIVYVLDTRNPLFQGVIDNPRIFAFDIESSKLVKTYILTENSFYKESYINDLRIDKKNSKMYLTDSGRAGLVIVDLNSGVSHRALDNHVSTLAETDHLNFDGKKWSNTVHSDGIALDTKNDLLYYHALTGYNLYAVPTNILIKGDEKITQENVKLIAKTPAPDGMIFDENGNVYLADLEHQKIMKLNVSSGEMKVFAEGNQIKWADTFSIHNDELYYTNSRINEAAGNIDTMVFDINKISIQ
ncbi:MAG: L-dopachrome tautomerase-related protein [Bacteroidota bacterium]